MLLLPSAVLWEEEGGRSRSGETERQRGGQGDQSQCSNIAVPGSSEPSRAWPARSQHCANIMEAFGDESYVGIKEMTMDMKVKLFMGIV